MPSSKNYVRDYAQEAATAKARGEVADSNTRHKARRAYEKANGDLPTSVEVDHKKKLKDGGAGTALSNLRARPASANRADNGQKPKGGKK